jgi:hypothetical protein
VVHGPERNLTTKGTEDTKGRPQAECSPPCRIQNGRGGHDLQVVSDTPRPRACLVCVSVSLWFKSDSRPARCLPEKKRPTTEPRSHGEEEASGRLAHHRVLVQLPPPEFRVLEPGRHTPSGGVWAVALVFALLRDSVAPWLKFD